MDIRTAEKIILENLNTCGDSCDIISCFNWMDAIQCGWDGSLTDIEYFEEIHYINEDVLAADMGTYYPLIESMLVLGREKSKEYIISIVKYDDPYVESLLD